VVEGGVEYGPTDQRTVRLAPGQLGVIGAPDERPITGRLSRGRYDHLIVEPRLLSERAGRSLGSERPVQLVGMAPVTPEANQRLAALVDYVKQCAATEEMALNPLLAATLEQHVATVLLATLPTTALSELARREPHEGGPTLLRRAEAYIDDNAQTDISLHDIASAIYVNPRTLQYMFRKHRDCTPMDYVRRVRLHHAHLDLVSANRLDTTVGQIAAKWGFGHLGRFAIYYREKYGQSPHLTLRGY
jgi:AraC-like DNA-binding protein